MSVIEGVVEKLVPGGRGLLRDDQGICLVAGALPGERVRVQVDRAQRKTRFGHVLTVLSPSPDRIEADCVHHPRCGGCDLLTLAPLAAARAKVEIVRDALLRVARLPRDVVDAVVAPIRAPAPGDDVGRRRARLVMRHGVPTFSAAQSHERVPIERCVALHETLQRALASIPLANGELRIACDDAGRVSMAPGPVVVLEGEVTAGLFPAKSDARIFTQATRFGGRAIIDAVLELARVQPGMRVLELFAGAGHLTLPLQAAGAYVDAVEGDALSVQYLRESSGVGRQAWIDGSLTCGRADVLVADPPRAGVKDLATLAARAGVRRCVLVSCDPATGARDIAALVTAGFRLERLLPIDAFPRTSHVEWVASLSS